MTATLSTGLTTGCGSSGSGLLLSSNNEVIETMGKQIEQDSASRPSIRRGSKLDDPELQEAFLYALLDTRTIKKACKKVGVSPAVFFFYVGRKEHHEFKATVDECRRAIGDTLFEEAVSIADEKRNDTIKETFGKGPSRVIPNNAAVARDRLRIDTRLRVAGKLRPREYGDAPAVAVSFQNNSILCDEETRLKIQDMRKQLLMGKHPIKEAHVIEEQNETPGQAPGPEGHDS